MGEIISFFNLSSSKKITRNGFWFLFPLMLLSSSLVVNYTQRNDIQTTTTTTKMKTTTRKLDDHDHFHHHNKSNNSVNNNYNHSHKLLLVENLNLTNTTIINIINSTILHSNNNESKDKSNDLNHKQQLFTNSSLSLSSSSSSSSSSSFSSRGSTTHSITTITTCPPFIPESIKSSYFHPKQFFENGLGKQYLDIAQKPNSQSRFVFYHNSKNNSSSTSSSSNNDTNNSCHNKIIYYHIHKNGGSTMAKTNFDNYPIAEVYYGHMQYDIGEDVFRNRTYGIWKEVWNGQQEQEQQQQQREIQKQNHISSSSSSSSRSSHSSSDNNVIIPTFTFIRDPAVRFISSLGQALSQKKGKMRFDKCNDVSKTRFDFMDCILTRMEQKQIYLNDHMEPQSYNLYRGITQQGDYDIGIYLIDMKSYFDIVLEEIMGVPNATTIPHRQSRMNTIAYNKFLLNEELAYEFRHRICKLYHVDVLMIRETNITTTICPLD